MSATDVKGRNRERIIQELAKNKRLRWTNLLDSGKVRLSKRALALHLRELEREGKIKRTVDAKSKEYPPPVYYELVRSKTNSVDLLMGQLLISSDKITDKDLAEGRKHLNEELLVNIMKMCSPKILSMDFDLTGTASDMKTLLARAQQEQKQYTNTLTNLIRQHFPINLDVQGASIEEKTILNNFLSVESFGNELLNPFVFHIFIMSYLLEKAITKDFKDFHAFDFDVLSTVRALKIEKQVDELAHWWAGLLSNIPGAVAIADLVGKLLLRQLQTHCFARMMSQIVVDLGGRLKMNTQDLAALTDKYLVLMNRELSREFEIDFQEKDASK